MKTLANTTMMVGAVVLMGWLILAQRAYQQSWGGNAVTQPSSASAIDLAASMDRALLALN